MSDVPCMIHETIFSILLRSIARLMGRSRMIKERIGRSKGSGKYPPMHWPAVE